MIYYYTLLTIFAILCYMIVVDANVGTFIILMWKYAGVQIRRFLFILKFKPRLMWDTWNLKRTIKGKKNDWADQAASEIIKERDQTS